MSAQSVVGINVYCQKYLHCLILTLGSAGNRIQARCSRRSILVSFVSVDWSPLLSINKSCNCFIRLLCAAFWPLVSHPVVGNISKRDNGTLDKIIKKSSTVVGRTQDSLDILYDRRVTKKLKDILKDATHPLRLEFDGLMIERSGRMRVPKARTSRYLSSFVPQAVIPALIVPNSESRYRSSLYVICNNRQHKTVISSWGINKAYCIVLY